MAVVVVSGSGRKVGKTAVGCALIRALPDWQWAAVKVTPHAHGREDGIYEEWEGDSEKDTGRYLAAGAKRSFLVSCEDGARATELVVGLRQQMNECDALLIESNRIELGDVAERGEPRLGIAVVGGATAEWKASLCERLASMDALVLSGGVSLEGLAIDLSERPVFPVAVGEWASSELVSFVRDHCSRGLR